MASMHVRVASSRRQPQLQQQLKDIRTGELQLLRHFEDSDSDSDPLTDMEEDCDDILSHLH